MGARIQLKNTIIKNRNISFLCNFIYKYDANSRRLTRKWIKQIMTNDKLNLPKSGCMRTGIMGVELNTMPVNSQAKSSYLPT